MKRCARCGEEKEETEFRRNLTRADGLQTYCKFCQIENNRRLREARPRNISESPERAREARRRWRAKNGAKHAVHARVAWAIKSGTLVRSQSCEECGSQCLTQAHHDDYSQVLEVRWLCQRCHQRRHAKVQK